MWITKEVEMEVETGIASKEKMGLYHYKSLKIEQKYRFYRGRKRIQIVRQKAVL